MPSKSQVSLWAQELPCFNEVNNRFISIVRDTLLTFKYTIWSCKINIFKDTESHWVSFRPWYNIKSLDIMSGYFHNFSRQDFTVISWETILKKTINKPVKLRQIIYYKAHRVPSLIKEKWLNIKSIGLKN